MNGAEKWWGYRHENGSYQVKRYYRYLSGAANVEDAYDSPFVDKVTEPFEACGRQQALDRCRAIITRRHGDRS